jgi:cell division septal protein FtsQ
MKLKPQPPVPRRGTRSARPTRRGATGGGGRGRQARRPGTPLRQRYAGRIPSFRRILAATAAVAAAAILVLLLNGPWLRVSRVAWAGEQLTDPAELEGVLSRQRGASLLAVDTDALRARLTRIPSVADATVTASIFGTLDAHIVERQPAFVWETAAGRFVGAGDGTIFTGGARGEEPATEQDSLPRVRDERFVARLVSVGDVIPAPILRIALRLAALDPAALGSATATVTIRLDDEYGFRLASADGGWEVALGVYGLDPGESDAEADARLERQITAVRTLFASRPEAEIAWVDVRNPGKVYFRAKG